MAKHKMEERTGSFETYYVSTHNYDPFYTMVREPNDSPRKSPHGNSLAGKWVLRVGPDANFVDFDQYRHDLAERYDIELIYGDEE